MGLWSLPGPDQPVLTKAEVAQALRLNTTAALDRLIASGRFPPGIDTGRQSPPIWQAQDVAAWLHLQGRMPRTPRRKKKSADPPPDQKPEKKTGG